MTPPLQSIAAEYGLDPKMTIGLAFSVLRMIGNCNLDDVSFEKLAGWNLVEFSGSDTR